MLLTSTRPLWRLAMNLLQTFVLPWGPLPLAIVVLTLAAIGVVVLLRRDRRGLVLLAGAAAPVRDLPPGLAGERDDALRAADRAGDRAAGGDRPARARAGPRRPVGCRGWAAAAVARWPSAWRPACRRCSPTPASRRRCSGCSRDMRRAGPAPDDVVVAMHRRAYAETRRVRGWVGPQGFPWRLLDAPAGHEWLELVRYWREGGTGRTWLLADLRRTDLALIDPASRHANGHYDWSTPFAAGVLGGTRPGGARLGGDRRAAGVVPRRGLGAVARDRRRLRASTARGRRVAARVGWMRPQRRRRGAW